MEPLWRWIESTELAFQIGATWWFPLLESVHVLGLVMLLGSILMIDLRLLGWVGRRYRPEVMARGMMRWVWLGFALAVVSGVGMFIVRPAAYAANTAFQTKLVLLLVAGTNLLVYRLATGANGRVSADRIAAAISLTVWFGVVLAGRWTGHLT